MHDTRCIWAGNAQVMHMLTSRSDDPGQQSRIRPARNEERGFWVGYPDLLYNLDTLGWHAYYTWPM